MKPSHHHDLIEVFNRDASYIFLTEMNAMWIAMAAMFFWMLVMQAQHHKFKKVFNDVINCEKCSHTDKFNITAD
jgi:hypothetical protein